MSVWERSALAVLLVIFTFFTWRGLTMFFSGDDMMNMYNAWNADPWQLARAQILPWIPMYRPLGAAVYRIFYTLFGFHPFPLYVFCWLLLAANAILAYRLFRRMTETTVEALTALSLVLVHGSFTDLYYSAGTMYDRFWLLFTVTGLLAWFRFRASPGWRWFAAVCLLSLFAMDSKESGVALPMLIVCCECIFFLPQFWRRREIRLWIRQVAPILVCLAIVSLLFVFGRVNHTPELALTPAYRPQLSPSLWLRRVGEYIRILTYDYLSPGPLLTGVLIAAMGLTAILMRNRAMLFGWLFFIITITPVALIAMRPGYVLYVPDLGLGLFFAALITVATAPLQRIVPQTGMVTFALVTIAVTWLHLRNWPPPWDMSVSPEARLSEQFSRDYPVMAPNSKLLFISDDFPAPAWDLLFNLRMLYHDKSIVAYRLKSGPDQQADPKHPPTYNHVFLVESGRYRELDPRDPAESVRLHILRDYAVAREMDISRRDYAAYVVSGLIDGDITGPSRWTEPRAKFKFDLYPAPTILSLKFWVPDFVAKTAVRKLSIVVNGKEVGTVPLSKDGMNEASFPVPASLISRAGYTFVEMNVAHPYTDEKGDRYGIVLLRAGFTYQPQRD